MRSSPKLDAASDFDRSKPSRGLGVVPGDAHALAAAAGARLDHHRIADLARRSSTAWLGVVDQPHVARHRRDPGLGRELLRGDLVAHRPIAADRRPDEGDPRRRERLGELGALREEAVARMHRLGAGRPDRLEDAVDDDVGLADRRPGRCAPPRRPCARAAPRRRRRNRPRPCVMPIRRAVLMTRQAISPRFAIRILSNIAASADAARLTGSPTPSTSSAPPASGSSASPSAGQRVAALAGHRVGGQRVLRPLGAGREQAEPGERRRELQHLHRSLSFVARGRPTSTAARVRGSAAAPISAAGPPAPVSGSSAMTSPATAPPAAPVITRCAGLAAGGQQHGGSREHHELPHRSSPAPGLPGPTPGAGPTPQPSSKTSGNAAARPRRRRSGAAPRSSPGRSGSSAGTTSRPNSQPSRPASRLPRSNGASPKCSQSAARKAASAARSIGRRSA